MDVHVKPAQATVVRFAGDSGDGIQLVGSRFTEASAVSGNDFFTFPDFPAEIRAPAGSLAGVSAFQVQLSDELAMTPGDTADVLVAMNPAALKTNLPELRDHGLLILNGNGFSARTLKQAGYASDPREDGSLDGYTVIDVEAGQLTEAALEGLDLPRSAMLKHKNFLMLGIVNWLFELEPQATLDWIERRFRQKLPEVAEANVRAFNAGYAYAETLELVAPTHLAATRARPAGHYRRVSGNEALGYGLLAASARSGLELVLSSYPITPASDVLHFLSNQASLGVRTLQAEDEIAAIGAAIGTAYAGGLAATTTSGPGLDLKAESLGLAVSLELPLLVIDIQRAGPSTGLPTKAEQSDLLHACFGRHGETPVPVIATGSPGDCFWAVLEAARIALRYMTPVIILSDAYVANGTEPWEIPEIESIPPIPVSFAQPGDDFAPYRRNADGARPWALPGTPGLEHRIGGLEKADLTGNVSYDPLNHERMCLMRNEKVRGIADSYPPSRVHGDAAGELLVVGWGGTFGALRQAVDEVRKTTGRSVGHLHLRHLNPLPNDLGEILSKFERVLVPELNSGQLTRLLRAEYLVDATCHAKLQGQPFKVAELVAAITDHLEKTR